MSKPPFILLLNPWVVDFAAHDLWANPLGLLFLGALLREGGCGVEVVDCMDRHDPFTAAHPDVLPGRDRHYGTGQYPRILLPKPSAYSSLARRYYRFGIHPESFRQKLRTFPTPDLIWVTSLMTYWYPGVQESIRLVKEIFLDVPVWLGGIYARLCPDHARRYSGADLVITEDVETLPRRIEEATGFALTNSNNWRRFETWPSPALDLLPHLVHAPILTSTGCPFRCPYCASHLLQPNWERRTAETLYAEICRCVEEYGVTDVAFYDDALLIHAEATLKPVLERLCRKGITVRFHTPNALHVRALTQEWCELLFASGFTTVRLGLETTSRHHQREWGGKVDTDMFLQAVKRLRGVGFPQEQIGVYLLCGLPGQIPEDVAHAIRVVADAGAEPRLCEYSPVPGTVMWENACAVASFPLDQDPLYHNNSFFACRRSDFTLDDLQRLKHLIQETRRKEVSRDG